MWKTIVKFKLENKKNWIEKTLTITRELKLKKEKKKKIKILERKREKKKKKILWREKIGRGTANSEIDSSNDDNSTLAMQQRLHP